MKKVLDQVLKQFVGELLSVASIGRTEDAVERVGVGALDLFWTMSLDIHNLILLN